ncbi:MAG: ATP-binding cassette domain-containing protein [Alphaproteobacteria bacterium]|nr:ATP-binding cassette domain-containing protein [Alphaproteobacteria bacterium]
MAPVLHLKDITVAFGGTNLLDGAELNVGPGERLCLVGRNGSGKSTLLKIAAGLVEPDGGTCFAQPGAAIRYLPQEPDLSGFATTRDYVEAGLDPTEDPNRAFYLLGNLGLDGTENPATLSGGEARRAALARCLAPRPAILLLDEPTNHLDIHAIEWLEGELKAMKSALVLISHDRRFLESLSRVTVWLDRGRTHRLEKGFGAFEAWRDAMLEQEEVERHKLERQIAAEEHWLRYGVSARRKRNVGRLERLKGLRTERREQVRKLGNVRMEAAEGSGSGTKVIDAKGVSFSYDDEKAIVRDVTLRVHRGDRIAIVGPNGAGKTTLLKLLTGKLKPQAGNVKLGQGLLMAELDQNRSRLHPEQSLMAAVTDGVEGAGGDTVMVAGKPRHVMNYLQDFLFTPAQARTPVKVLSGGERARLLLAKLFATPSNFLVLDEPTNDLDLETLDLLEEVIADYQGTALLVSHDRDFLDRVATAVVLAEGDGRFTVYAGGYSDMLAQRGGDAPKRTNANKSRDSDGAARPEKAARPQRATAAKMNFADAHALKTLPDKIAAAEVKIAALEESLSDSALYARDPKRFAALSAELSDLRAAKEADEERWLALEMEREALETDS